MRYLPTLSNLIGQDEFYVCISHFEPEIAIWG